jgi:phosphatidylglycerol lysyltransferase
MKKSYLHVLGPALGLILFAAAIWVIHNELREFHYHDIVNELLALSARNLFLALGLTILSYMMMTGYDVLALQYIKYQLPYSKIALASFIGYAFSNSIGFSMLAGSSVRYRLYSAWGLSGEEITKVVAFCSLTLWMGFLTLGGIVFLLEPMVIPEQIHLPFASVHFMGFIFLFLVGGYLFWSLVRKRPIKIFNWEIALPSFRIFLIQITVASMDWILAGSVLYALMPAAANVSFAKFIGIYLLAQTAGLLSQIPGGLGVFETVIIMLLSKNLPAPALLGPLIVYRIIYYLIPLMSAAVMLGAHEILEKKEGVKRVVTIFGRWITVIAPHILSITTFVSGIILIFSGATPTVGRRLLWLKDFLPLPVMEISHFLGSIAGMGLLLLARGIQQRLDAAYIFTVLLLATGIGFSIVKGFDYEEAIVLSIMLGVLLPCRRYFYRKASLFSQRFTPAWITAIGIIFLGSVWIGIFSYKHIEYSSELWWQFTFSGDASRFLRATIGIIAVTLFFAVRILLQPSLGEPVSAGAEELQKACLVIDKSRMTFANLALLGDKKLLFSESGKSFIMYSIEGHSWVALGDPVGLDEESSELVWQFREISDRQGGWTVFYEVGKENLHRYLDLGLTIIKIGEEARVPLGAFSLEGRAHKGFRHLIHHIEKEGCSFDIIPAEKVPALIPELKRISDFWLQEKNTREKRFSLGFFNEKYIEYFPVAIVRKGGKIFAFANIWTGGEKEELSIDLMRYLPEAPQGIMDYLFINMMLWGKQGGYQWFNIGMAPLSGLENHTLAPLWNRLGAFIFRHGEHFYNFQGLRQYKEKFDPEWEPKYIAVPGGLKLPQILTNLATLISGSLKGVVAK